MRRSRSRLTQVLVGALIAALVGLGLVNLVEAHRVEARQASAHQALTVAVSQMRTLLSVEPATVRTVSDSLLGQATRRFRAQLEQIRAQFARSVQQGGISSRARVTADGVRTMSADRVRALIALDLSLHRAAGTAPTVRPLRLLVDLVRHEGRWLLAEVRFVP